MTLRKKILLGLLVPAVLITLLQIFQPDEGLELLCIIFTVPVAVLNMWEWTNPNTSERNTLAAKNNPLNVAGEYRLDIDTAQQKSSSYEVSEEKSALEGETKLPNKKISIRTYGILLIVSGVLIMAAIFAHVDFGIGKLILGMVGFIAFTAGLYLTFG
jgi:uncharacterized membrane protein YidH (DUF202 family)